MNHAYDDVWDDDAEEDAYEVPPLPPWRVKDYLLISIVCLASLAGWGWVLWRVAEWAGVR